MKTLTTEVLLIHKNPTNHLHLTDNTLCIIIISFKTSAVVFMSSFRMLSAYHTGRVGDWSGCDWLSGFLSAVSSVRKFHFPLSFIPMGVWRIGQPGSPDEWLSAVVVLGLLLRWTAASFWSSSVSISRAFHLSRIYSLTLKSFICLNPQSICIISPATQIFIHLASTPPSARTEVKQWQQFDPAVI